MPPIVVDTREKKPWEFPAHETIEKPLNAGDYTHEGKEAVYAVERKSLNDLATSIGTERDRFENEIQRAQVLREFVVLIEAPKAHVSKYAGQGHSPKYYSNIYPNSILGTVSKWPEKYDTLSFEWCGNRRKAKQKCLKKLDKWYMTYG